MFLIDVQLLECLDKYILGFFGVYIHFLSFIDIEDIY